MMTTTIFELNAEKREVYGKRASRRLRRLDNKVPAVLYGAGKANESVMINHDEAIVALQEEAFYSRILTIHVGSSKEQAVLKAVQRHPYKNKLLHLDFMRVMAGEKLTMSVPLHFIGAEEAPGVKQDGGVVTHHLNDVEVSCLPKDLPEFIELDIGAMTLDQVLHLSDLKVPSDVELTALSVAEPRDEAVVVVHMPKIEKEEEPEGTAEAGAEPEEGGESTEAEGKEMADAAKVEGKQES